MPTTKSVTSSSSSQAAETQHKKRKTEDEGLDDETDLYIPYKDRPQKLQSVKPSKYPNIKKYLDMTKPELQTWLRHNGQLVTGRKQDLLLRCIDGEINGRIPGCNVCHTGQLSYDYAENAFICRGGFDEVSQNPIRCGNIQSQVKRESWHDLNRDPPVAKGEAKRGPEQDQSHDKNHHHKEHPDHQHHQHTCTVEANHPLVDLLEDMAYYHSILRDENWGYRSRAFISAARAIEHLPYEIDGKVHDALRMGDSRDEKHHIERIGKSSAEVMQAFLDSGKTRSPHLEDLKAQAKKMEKSQGDDGEEKKKD